VKLDPVRQFALPSVLLLGYLYTLWMVLAYIPIHLTDLGLSHLQIGILISVFPLASLLLVIPSGVFSDRLSPKPLVGSGLALFALFLLGLRYGQGFGEMLLLFLLGGIGGSLFQVSCSSLYYKFLGEGNRGRKIGFFTGLGLFGYALGPLSGGYLLERLDMDTLFWIAFLSLLPFLGLSFFLKNVKPVKFELMDYRRDIASKEVAVLAALTLLLSLHMGAEQTSFSLFLKKDIGLMEASIGRMFFFIGVTVSTLSIANGFVSDRVSARGGGLAPLLYLGMSVSGLFNIALLFAGTFSTVLTVRLLHVFGDSLFLISQRVIISKLFHTERIGGNLGLLSTVHTLGIFVGAIISGAIPGYILPFVLVGSLALGAIAPAMLIRPKF
jgi:MFS family permease